MIVNVKKIFDIHSKYSNIETKLVLLIKYSKITFIIWIL